MKFKKNPTDRPWSFFLTTGVQPNIFIFIWPYYRMLLYQYTNILADLASIAFNTNISYNKMMMYLSYILLQIAALKESEQLLLNSDNYNTLYETNSWTLNQDTTAIIHQLNMSNVPWKPSEAGLKYICYFSLKALTAHNWQN